MHKFNNKMNLRNALLNNIHKFNSIRFLSHYPVDDIISGITNEQIQLRKTIFNLAQKELASQAHKIDKENRFDGMREFWRKLGNIGALGVIVNPKYGGTGGSYLDLVIFSEELSRVSASVGMSYSAHTILCVNQIHRHGSHEQKQKYLPKLCSGEHVGALGMSEQGSGSDVISMKLRADKDGDHYILNGTKFWITNGPDAHVLVVYAKTNPNAKKPQHGISTFIIEKTFEGFSTGPKLDKLGMRGSNTSELIFDNCRVPKENLLGEENKGVYVLMSGLDVERIVIATASLGIMQACCDVTFNNYANQRKQINTKNVEFQMIESKLSNMYVTTSLCRTYIYNVCRAYDRNHIAAKDCAGVALYVSEKTTQIALDTVEIIGENGYLNDSVAGRLLRDAKLYEIGGGTNEVRKLVIARGLTKEYS